MGAGCGVWIRSWGQGVGVWIRSWGRVWAVDWWGMHGDVCKVRYARWGMQGEVRKVGYAR